MIKIIISVKIENTIINEIKLRNLPKIICFETFFDQFCQKFHSCSQMFVELLNPESISHQELDIYLANGWFRMGQAIFTTNFLRFNNIFHSAIWLRIDLDRFKTSKFQQKLLKLNTHFTVRIEPFFYTWEQEDLFQKYRNHVAFDAAPTLASLLYVDKLSNIYDTYAISIFDNDKLIAVGILDLGNKSATGISCFYDPDYKKHSLGKYLMYLKMDFCIEKGYDFFYPGYFVPGYSLFDYKLDLNRNALQFLDLVADKWRDFEEYTPKNIPFDEMCLKLRELGSELDKRDVVHQFQYYDFFDADMAPNLNGLGLFDFPVFIFCFGLENIEMLIPLVVFDVREKQYHLVLCDKIYKSVFDECMPEHYNKYLLQLSKFLYTGDSVEEMSEVIVMYGKEIMKTL